MIDLREGSFPAPEIIVETINKFIVNSGFWHCAASWSLGHIPNENEDVIISGFAQCYIHGDACVRNLTIFSGSTVHIENLLQAYSISIVDPDNTSKVIFTNTYSC